MPGYKDGGPASIPCTEPGFTSGARAEDEIDVGGELDVGTAVGMVFASDVVGVAFASDVGWVCRAARVHVKTVTWYASTASSKLTMITDVNVIMDRLGKIVSVSISVTCPPYTITDNLF